MNKCYKIRILDTLSEPTMLDVNPNFVETEDTCYSNDYYFTNDYESIKDAEQALEEVIANYPNNYIEYTIVPVYS